jgi:hypothetical protein
MPLFKARANLLPATLTRMEIPLRSIKVFEQQSDCLFAEGAVARFDWNWHKEFYLATMRPRCTSQSVGVRVDESVRASKAIGRLMIRQAGDEQAAGEGCAV